MAMSTTQHTIEFFLEIGNVQNSLKALEQQAKLAYDPFKAGVASGGLTPAQRKGAIAAQGQQQAIATSVYRAGGYGSVGSQGAKTILNEAKRIIRETFGGVGLEGSDRKAFQAAVNAYEAEFLTNLAAQAKAQGTEVAGTAAYNAKNKKFQQATTLSKAERAANEKLIQKLGLKEKEDAEKSANAEAAKARARFKSARTAQEEARREAAAAAKASKSADTSLSTSLDVLQAKTNTREQAERDVAAAEAQLVKNRKQKQGYGPDSEAGQRAAQAQLALIAAQEAEAKQLGNAQKRGETAKQAKLRATAASKATELALVEVKLASEQVDQSQAVVNATTREANSVRNQVAQTEASRKVRGEQEKRRGQTQSQIREAEEREKKAKHKSAQAAETQAVKDSRPKTEKGEALYGAGAVPSIPQQTKDFQKRLEAQERRILANAKALGDDTPDLTRRDTQKAMYDEREAILAEQNLRLRAQRKVINDNLKEMQRQNALTAKFGTSKNKYEAEAAAAAEARADAIRYGVAKEAAALQQLDGVKRGINATDKDILKLAGQEKALRAARVAAEKSAEVSALGLTTRGPDGKFTSLRQTVVQGEFDQTKEAAIQKAQLAERLAADRRYTEAKAKSAAAAEKAALLENVAVQKKLSADAQYIAATEQAALGKQAATIRELSFQATNQQFQQQEAQIRLQRQAIQIQIRNAELAQLKEDEEAIREKAKGIVLEEQYNRALAKEVQAQAAEAGLTRGGLLGKLQQNRGGGGGLGGGGRFGIGEGGGLGGFFGSGLATTLKYAVPSALLFGAVAGISAVVREAEELERQMVLIEGQFEAVDDAADFPQFRESILEIARDTGLAAEEVAKIGFQLKGAFDAIDAATGEKIDIGGFSGDQLVEEQLRASAEIAKVTGLSQEEIVDSLTATSLAFGTTFREVGNVTLDLQGRFGVLAKEIIPFLGDIAPVAEEAGFTLEEFATVAALTQQRSGRSGTALAEAYGRVIPAVTDAKDQLLQLAATNDALNNQQFLQAVADGDVSQILLQVAGSFSSMDSNSQDFVRNLLGGRRESAAIIAAFQDGDTLLSAINDTSRDNNQLQERFNELQETLAERTARLAEKFRQLGVAIFESGLGDFLSFLADSLLLLTTGLTNLLNVFSGFNDVLGGIPGKLLAIAAALKIIQLINNKFNVGTTLASFGQRTLTGAQGLLGQGPGQLALPGLGGGFGGSLRGQGFRGGVRQFGSNARAGLNSPLGAGLTFGAAALSLLELKGAREDAGRDINAAGERLTARLTEVSEEEAAAFVEARTGLVNSIREDGFAATIGAFVTGAKSTRERGIDAQQLQSSARVQGALQEAKRIVAEQELFTFDSQGNQQDQITPEMVQEILTNLEQNPTDDDAYREAQNLIEGLAGADTAIRDRINLAITNAQRAADGQASLTEQQEETAADLETSKATLESVKSQYESGSSNILELQQSYDAVIRLYRQTLELGTVDDPALVAALDEAVQSRNEVVSSALRSQSDLAQQLRELAGRGGPGEQIRRLSALLSDPQFRDPAQRQEVALEIVGLQQEMLEARAEAADDAGEALRILSRGVRIPRAVRVELVRQQLGQNNREFAEFVNGAVGVGQALASAFRDNVIRALSDGRRGTRILVRQLRQRRRDLILLLENAAGTAGLANAAAELQNIDNLLRELESQNPFGVVVPGRVRGSRDAREGYQQEQLEAGAEYAQAVADAQAEAAEEAAEAAAELEEARADYFRALIENDPVALARFEIQEADRLYRQAETEAERIRAQAERVRADRRLQEALQDVFASQFDLVTAMLNYAGDTVGVSRVALKQAQENLQYLQRSGAGDAQINRAKAAVIDAQAGLRDARLNRRLEDYQFLYDMDRINRQQYIAYLMQLRETPDLTRDQLRALDRQIKQLRDELGADFQFNLPTTLGLPTLYEVRRASQTPGGPAAYNDNRVVTFNINVESGADLSALEAALSESVGTNVNGTIPRRY